MRATLLCLSALLLVPPADAAPAPDPGLKAKEKLEALKKRLPGVLTGWVNERDNITWLPEDVNQFTCKPELRVLRRVAPERAKAVILFASSSGNGEERYRPRDVVLTVCLTCHDGYWTTEMFEVFSRQEDFNQIRRTFAFLMLAIDEAAEKP